ncbi:MAG: hypothetical protein R3275_10880 [Saprospiraceae bacterium]|nr:hypothetical protein [Saprospiraceae bacterium]
MTLQDFFDVASANPSIIIFYFTAVPLTTLLACLFSPGQGHLTPWRELFSVLLYLAAVPGTFAVMLTVYLLLIEGQTILDTNIYTQILPIVSMSLTIFLIHRHVDLDLIPGFDRLSGLFWMVFATLLLLWILDRTHIFAIVQLPFLLVVALVAGLLILVRFGLKKASP